jgi:energy-coupling factor transporter transmembrane protein EcfT
VTEATTPSSPPKPDSSWSHRLLVWAAVIVGLVVAAVIAGAFIPRWWAHRVGDQANESFAGGIMLGLFYGFVFTVLPLLLIIWGIRRRRSARAWLFILGGVILLALPNLFTLGIVFGPGGAAHAGERTLDVKAPGYRNASLAGALLAVAAVCFVWYLVSSRNRAREELRRHKQALRETELLREASNAPVRDGDAQHADADQGDRP